MSNAYRLMDENIWGESYKSVLALCFQYADYFTLNDYRLYLGYDLPLRLESFVVESFKTAYAFLNPTYNYDDNGILVPADKIETTIYKATQQAKEIVSYISNNIYLEAGTIEIFEPKLNRIVSGTSWHGEDLCFYRGNKLFFGTLSHEYECVLYPQSKEMLSLFQNHATWLEMNHYLQYVTKLSDYPISQGLRNELMREDSSN